MYVCLRLERNPHPQCRPSDLAGPSGPGRIPLLGFLGLGLLLPAVRNIGITIVEVILTIVVRLVLLNLVGAMTQKAKGYLLTAEPGMLQPQSSGSCFRASWHSVTRCKDTLVWHNPVPHMFFRPSLNPKPLNPKPSTPKP